MISVLLPSRERPAALSRALSSLAFGDIEIIVGLDSDDPTAAEAEQVVAEFPLARVVKGPRQPTLAHVFNTLQAQAQYDWFVPFPDDYTIDQKDWSEKLLHAAARCLPLDYGVLYLWDRLYPFFATFPVVHRKTVDLQGFYMPTFFPFLYGDTWWNEVGVMSGLIQPVKASVTVHKEGDNHKFRDLRIWSRMFETLRPLREETALKLIEASMADAPDMGRYLCETLPGRRAKCIELQAPSQTDEWCELNDKRSDDYVNPHYSDLLRRAEQFLEMAQCLPSSSLSSPPPP